MPSDARRLAALVDGPQSEGSGKSPFRKELAAHTKALFESFGAPLPGIADAPFAALLRTMASFPTYSLGNQALIAIQAPGAQTLSSATRWADFGRRLVNHARAIHIWAPADSNPAEDRETSGYARPSLKGAEQIARALGLRVTEDGDYQFDAHAVSQNALWGASQIWRSVRSARISDGGDHIAVKLILKDGRAIDCRARTTIGLVRSLMQAGTSPNDETISAYLALHAGDPQRIAARTRDFLQRFKLVPVYELSDTDGPNLPEVASIDGSESLKNLLAHLGSKQIDATASEQRTAARAVISPATGCSGASSTMETQLAHALNSAAEVLSHRRAQALGREVLKVEREAVKFVLAMHFGLDAKAPELGYGLAPNVEPHAAVEVVKARLITIHELVKDIVLAASPNYENPLLKALHTARTPAPSAVQARAKGQPAIDSAASMVGQPALRVPRQKAHAKHTEPLGPTAPMLAISDDFNPFADEASDGADFNPFA